jgi:FkbM family methyltransferase
MPMMVRLPRNDDVVRTTGGYRSGLNFLSRKQTAVQRQLRRGGLASYEPATQATLLSLVQIAARPTTFLDIGAHIGLYSALVAEIFSASEVAVVAFEPTPETAGLARQLMRANRLPVVVEETAVSSQPGVAQLYISSTTESSNSLKLGFRDATQTVPVVVTTVDEYCAGSGVVPGVIKIDVETLEANVLLGALSTLDRARPAIVCELLRKGDQRNLTRALASLDGMGYVLHHLGRDLLWHATPSEDYQDYLSSTRRDWLLVPGDLPAGLHHAMRVWLDAIAVCTEATNLMVPPGERAPEGWDRNYAL